MKGLWKALKAYQPQADADGHGESWQRACEKQTVDALENAIEDSAICMKEADPDWESFATRRSDEYERIYTAGEAMICTVDALSSEFEREANIDLATRLIQKAQELE
jgi:hypothetical protein